MPPASSPSRSWRRTTAATWWTRSRRSRTSTSAQFSDDDYDTVGGLVTAAIGHLPEAGEELELERFHFRVSRADQRRVHAFHLTVRGDAAEA
jgi:Mg2+/Co2+ transporter CorC